MVNSCTSHTPMTVTHCWCPSPRCRVSPGAARCESWQEGRSRDGFGLLGPARLSGQTGEADSSWETWGGKKTRQINSDSGDPGGGRVSKYASATEERRHTVMKDSPSASSPDRGSDSHPDLALSKETDNDEVLRPAYFRGLYRLVDRPCTWQWGLGLVKYWCQRRCRGETAGKRLSGGQAVGSAGTWMNLWEHQSTFFPPGTNQNKTHSCIWWWLPVCLRQSWPMAATERTHETGGALRIERCYTSLLLPGYCRHPHPVWVGPWGWSRYLRDQNCGKIYESFLVFLAF